MTMHIKTKEVSKIKLDPSYTGHKYINNRRRSGYTPESALGELIDNPIDSIVSATKIQLHFHLKKSQQKGQFFIDSICVIDNGTGMSSDELINCHKLGSSRKYTKKDLGRFGEGGIMGSLSISAARDTFSRDHNGVLNGRGYDMDLVKQEDNWGTFPIDITKERKEWFDSIIGNGKTGTIIVLKQLDLLRPSMWEYIRRRLEDYLPATYDSWISSASDKCITVKAFHENKEVYNWDVPSYDPLHWSQSYSKNAGRQEEVIDIDGHKIKIRTVYLDPVFKVKVSKLKKNQGGYLYRNGRLISMGEKLQSMLRGSYPFHNDYRRMRYGIYYEADADDIMGTRPSKDGINPEQNVNDKIVAIISDTQSWVIKEIRAQKSKENADASNETLSDLESKLETAVPKNKAKPNSPPKNPNPNPGNPPSGKPNLKKKRFQIVKVKSGRMGIIGEYGLSSSPDYKYELSINVDHPTVSYIMDLDPKNQDICYQILFSALVCTNGFGCTSDVLTQGEKQILIDRFVRNFDETLRNLITLS